MTNCLDGNTLATISFVVNLLSSIGSFIALPVFIWQIARYRNDEQKVVSSRVSARCIIDGRGPASIIIYNNSSMPIYDVIASVDLYSSDINKTSVGNNNCHHLNCVAPGKTTLVVPYPGGGMHMRFGASITFRDNKDIYWTRFANGHLTKHKRRYFYKSDFYFRGRQEDSFEFRKIDLPCDEASGSITEVKDY